MVEPMGAETLLHLLADGRDLRAVVDRRVRVPVGATVHAHLRPSQTHIFDAQGRRIALARPSRSGRRHERAGRSAPGMSAATARSIEYAIIGLCVLALVLIFQPFSLTLYGIGAGLVVLGGLAFNLIPHCRPGVPLRWLLTVALIVLTLLIVVFLLALGSTYLYALYLEASR